MSERSNLISKLQTNIDTRTSYIKAKLGVLVPSQIRALRLKSDMPRQADLAETAGMHQSRISAFETPGAANVTLETLSRIAAAFRVGLVVRFVPFSEMLQWENQFSQDNFEVPKLENDAEFLEPRVDISQTPIRPLPVVNELRTPPIKASQPESVGWLNSYPRPSLSSWTSTVDAGIPDLIYLTGIDGDRETTSLEAR